jgi:putative protein-disulfide isomerase
MNTTVTYLFDPLCGWCYGASPMIQKLEKLTQQSSFALELAPTGLFAGVNSRVMDATFAQYAWSNDLRIGKMTGQLFTEAYRTQVLGQTGSLLNSELATLALTAVSLTEPQREFETLKLFQEARYIHGLDITSPSVVEKLLRDKGLAAAADKLASGATELSLSNDARLQRAQRLMQTFGATGVPALIVTKGDSRRLLRGDALFGSFDSLMDSIYT